MPHGPANALYCPVMVMRRSGGRSHKKKQKIVVVKTGEPVPKVATKRGQIADLIAGSIGDAFQGEYAVVDVRTEAPPALGPNALVVITGSSANVPDRAPWMLKAEAWLRHVVASGTPTFGICFGHQIL